MRVCIENKKASLKGYFSALQCCVCGKLSCQEAYDHRRIQIKQLESIIQQTLSEGKKKCKQQCSLGKFWTPNKSQKDNEQDLEEITKDETQQRLDFKRIGFLKAKIAAQFKALTQKILTQLSAAQFSIQTAINQYYFVDHDIKNISLPLLAQLVEKDYRKLPSLQVTTIANTLKPKHMEQNRRSSRTLHSLTTFEHSLAKSENIPGQYEQAAAHQQEETTKQMLNSLIQNISISIEQYVGTTLPQICKEFLKRLTENAPKLNIPKELLLKKRTYMEEQDQTQGKTIQAKPLEPTEGAQGQTEIQGSVQPFKWKQIPINQKIRSLDMSNRNINDGEMIRHIPLLFPFQNITQFEIRNNKLSILSCKIIGKGMQQLLKIDVRGNKIGDQGVICLSRGLRNLKSFFISETGATDISIIEIYNRLPKIELLWAQHLSISEECALMLMNMQNLRVLSLLGNPIGQDTAKELRSLFGQKGCLVL